MCVCVFEDPSLSPSATAEVAAGMIERRQNSMCAQMKMRKLKLRVEWMHKLQMHSSASVL